MKTENLISLAEAAQIAGLTADHLRRLAERGDLEAQKVGRNWATTRRAINAYMRDTEKRSNDPYKYRRR